MFLATVYGKVGFVDIKSLGDKKLLKCSVAVQKRSKDASGQWNKDGTTWINIMYFQRQGRDLPVVNKGDLVLVSGNICLDHFIKKNGKDGMAVTLMANSLISTSKNTFNQGKLDSVSTEEIPF